MAEEHGFQAPEGHRLCANNCGFFGSLTSSKLCSKCHRDLRMTEEQGALAKAAFDGTPSIPVRPTASSACLSVAPAVKVPESQSPDPATAKPNRCVACRKRVGLTGFKCRCGSVFCGGHRYPEQHACAFDYKAAGKEAIARANPLVKAQKLNRI